MCDANSIITQMTLADMGALADRHGHHRGIKKGAGRACGMCSKGSVMIEKKTSWLDAQLIKGKLIAWRIALAAVFFFLKQTIRCLD